MMCCVIQRLPYLAGGQLLAVRGARGWICEAKRRSPLLGLSDMAIAARREEHGGGGGERAVVAVVVVRRGH